MIVAWISVLAALAFVTLVVRVAYILSANTIGEMTQELLYLRMDALRVPLILGMSGILLEIFEFVWDVMVLGGYFVDAPLRIYINALQAALFLTSGAFLYSAIRPYSPAGIERRIEENMETIALLGGARRRRRAGERGEVRRERSDRETRRERESKRE